MPASENLLSLAVEEDMVGLCLVRGGLRNWGNRQRRARTTSTCRGT